MLPVLSEKELDRLEDLLITYGNDYSVLNLAELNGFFVALASSPVTVLPEQWLRRWWVARYRSSRNPPMRRPTRH